MTEEELKDEPSFEELLNAYSSGMKDDLRIGDKITGRIISVSGDTVFVDTGTKSDGVVEKAELLDADGAFPHAEGDTVELFVVAMDEGEIRLSRAVSGVGGVHQLREAYANHIPVEGNVTETCKGGFRVTVLQRKAFCPISQIDVAYTENPDEFVGKTFNFEITAFEEGGRNIVLSRRKILEAERAKAHAAFFSELAVGDLVEGTVTRIVPFGVFLELIPGVEGLVHVSELGWSRVDNPEQATAVGEVLKAAVVKIETDAKGRRKIGLSVKQAGTDPWETVTERFASGQKVRGRVVRLAPFGAFVEIAPGIDGLVHISEMSYTRRIVHPEDVVGAGDTVSVMIKDIDLGKRRISLSLKDAEGDPWLDVEERFPVGQPVTGTLEKKERFGYFIRLAPGVTGLLPMSRIARAEESGKIEKTKVGDPVPVVVDRIDLEARKISLMPPGETDSENWETFTPEAAPPMSDLAAKLKAALEKGTNGER